MSNPFATFRKNQKVWMAALVLLAIMAFVVAPAIDTATTAFSGNKAGDSVVVRWDGGKMTLASLQTYAQKHSILVRFLSALAREVIDAGGTPDVPGFFYDEQSNEILGLGIQPNSSEGIVCRSRLLAEHARRQGISFSDEAIDEFIIAYCDDRIATKRIEELLSETSGGRLSWYEVREMLKGELSALVAQQLARSGLFSIPPGKTYQDFRKLNQTAKIESFPFYADEYLDQVTGTPGEAELQAIYEAGAPMPANPNSPEPGFRRNYQANIEYISANTQTWIDREKSKLSEEQLREEYDRRVALNQLQVPVEPALPPTAVEEGDGGTVPSPDVLESPASEPSTADSPILKDSEDGNSAPESPAPESPAPESPAPESPAPETSTEGSDVGPDAEAKRPDEQDQSQGLDRLRTPGNSPEFQAPATRLVAFTQEPSTTGTVNETSSADAGEVPPPAANETTAEAEQAESATTENTAAEISATAQEPAAATEIADPQTPLPSGGEEDAAAEDASGESAASNQDAGPTMRTQTFDEARDTIADSLARDAALAAQQEALTDLLENVMQPYYSAYRQYEAFIESGLDKDENGNPRQPPQKPDLKRLAEEAGFEYNETGLIDGNTLAQIPFGLGNVMPDESGLSGSITNVVMNPNVELFSPMQGMYFDQAALMAGGMPEFLRYVFWKVEDREAFVPLFEDIRDEVVDAWKRQRAMQLAAAAADELAKKVVANSEDPWTPALSEAEKSLVVETSPFTWMTALGGEPRLSGVPALRDVVGGEFMQRIFSTPSGQAVVAPNAGHSIYYVCRVVEFSPSESELRERFQADPLKSGPFAIARQESDMMLSGWFGNIEQQLGVEWQMNVGQFN